MNFFRIAFILSLVAISFGMADSNSIIVRCKKTAHGLLPPDTLFVDSMIFSNYFSPNGDGINDEFIIKNVELYPNNELRIFNRLGEPVFAAKPYLNDWSGQSNQGSELFRKEVSDGIYLFEFLSGEGQRASGKITVKR